jgi:tryptophan-rich sensory protein
MMARAAADDRCVDRRRRLRAGSRAIFRARNLRLSYVIGCIFAGLDTVLLALVSRVDVLAAWPLLPYLVYRVYAVWWGRALVRLNPLPSSEGG